MCLWQVQLCAEVCPPLQQIDLLINRQSEEIDKVIVCLKKKKGIHKSYNSIDTLSFNRLIRTCKTG